MNTRETDLDNGAMTFVNTGREERTKETLMLEQGTLEQPSGIDLRYVLKTDDDDIPYEDETADFTQYAIKEQKRCLVRDALAYGL